jgi:hypothetical protein
MTVAAQAPRFKRQRETRCMRLIGGRCSGQLEAVSLVWRCERVLWLHPRRSACLVGEGVATGSVSKLANRVWLSI